MRAIISSIRIFFFAVWSVSCILFATLCCMVLFSKKPTVFLAKYLWSPVALFIMGARLRVEGIEKVPAHTSFVVMANHCSYLDIPALFKALPVYLYFVAKKELKRMPFLGWFMILADMIFIDRRNTASAKESLAGASDMIRKGKHIVIFPEGTASKTGQINEFKKGGFFMAQDAEAAILPIHITGTYHVWPSAAKLNMRRGKILVKIGDPITAEEYLKYDMDDRVKWLRKIITDL